MQLIEEKAIARGMVRLEPGEDLLGALEVLVAAAGWSDAHVTGTGRLDLVELEDPEGPRSLERAEIVSLTGRLGRDQAPRVFAQLYAGQALHAGRILAAVTGPMLLVVDAEVARGPSKPSAPAHATPKAGSEQASVPPFSQEAEPTPTPRASSPVLPTSPLVARPPLPTRAEIVEEPLEEEHWMEVSAGDLLDHPQFGRCDVIGDDESGGIRVRIPSGRVCVLRLDTLEVAAPADEPDGRRLFRVVGPRRRR